MDVDYPFLRYINEDKSKYKTAREAGYIDPYDDFLIGDSGGFLMNIQAGDRYVNTNLLIEVANYFRKYKKYTPYKEGSLPYEQFRLREEDRRKNGFTAPCLLRNGKIKNLHITGGHYNFINYCPIEQLDESSVKTGTGGGVGKKHVDFAKFIDAQYWTWKVMEFCENNGFHLIIDKTRRGGFSYIQSSDDSNTLNLYPKKVIIHVANDYKYLTQKGGLSQFTIDQLIFYETKSPFKRGILSYDSADFKLGYKLKNNIEPPNSWGSALLSVSAANNPECAIGKDGKKIKVEELSTMINFDDFMTVTEPAMRTGSYLTGNMYCWGTNTTNDISVFEANFFSPNSHNFMPFENVWDKDARGTTCGFFKPYVWGLQGEDEYGNKSLDSDGNSNIIAALSVAAKERKNKKLKCKTFGEFINYCGQYANEPAESFNSISENIFSSETLDAWEKKLSNEDSYKFYDDGMLYKVNDEVVFMTNKRLQAEGKHRNIDWFEYIENVPIRSNEHHHGCIRRFFPPVKIDTIIDEQRVHAIPKGLYSICYDPVGIDKINKEITSKHSHNSIAVYENPHAVNGFKGKCVAVYYGRPESLEEADYICYLLAIHYDCIGTTNVEINRGETISNFKKWKATKYLSKEPVFIWDNTLKGMTENTYGYSIGSDKKKLEGLRLLKEWLYTIIGKDEKGSNILVLHSIYDHPTILEIKKFNTTGNFDRVSQMIIRAIEVKAMDIKAKSNIKDRKKVIDEEDILTRNWY